MGNLLNLKTFVFSRRSFCKLWAIGNRSQSPVSPVSLRRPSWKLRFRYRKLPLKIVWSSVKVFFELFCKTLLQFAIRVEYNKLKRLNPFCSLTLRLSSPVGVLCPAWLGLLLVRNLLVEVRVGEGPHASALKVPYPKIGMTKTQR